jgi:hypothetical protein
MFSTLRLLLVGAVLLVSGAAQAVGFYAEIKTSSAFPIFTNMTGRVTLEADFDPLTFDWDASSVGPGLGSSLIPPTKNYTHTFAPSIGVASVQEAWLFVSVIDDLDLSPETVRIDVDGSLFEQGSATLDVFFGTVTASISAAGDTIDVSVSSVSGDFRILASALKVKFTPVPEPTTALLMALGLGGLAWSSRRRMSAAA